MTKEKYKLWFNLPKIKKNLPNPVWNGDHFLIKNKKELILDYSENNEGWNDELTKFHEDNAGQNHPIDLASRRRAIKSVQHNISKYNQEKVLEIGSSSGFLLNDLAKLQPRIKLVGSDIVYQPLIKLAKQLRYVPILKFDILNHPLEDEIFDQVIALNVLEHIKDDNQAIKNINKLLKPNGSFIIEVPAFQFLFDNYDKELKHFRRYSMKDMIHKLQNHNFEIIYKSYLGFLIFPLFALFKLRRKLFKQKYNTANVINNTSNSFFLKKIMNFESFLSRYFRFPFGIRIIILARKIS